MFVPGQGGYARLRADFLKLTGPIPMPPLWAFGFWQSRYYAYSEESALQTIRAYRRRGIPLDVFVMDTDWRDGASHGYTINKRLFPDMARFIRRAHREGVRLVFNDHPEPVDKTALSPAELTYRYRGLARLLKMGADAWWYDRNWDVHLAEPMAGLRKEVWGMRLYHDMAERVAPDRRPLIMSNVDGIDGGVCAGASHPASHRFPVWWTGDTPATWTSLRSAVENCITGGIERMMPYINDDLGGHFGMPTEALYVRFLQFGALCPIMRIHCSNIYIRYPWAFGKRAEAIVTEYVKLRYRLLPTLYAAARRAHEDGTPLLRRCDLEWPRHKEAKSTAQYLLGDDLLVAPMMCSAEADGETVPPSLLRTDGGAPGLMAEYFTNTDLSGDPVCVRRERRLDHDLYKGWNPRKVDHGAFSVRWTGVLGPVPESTTYEVGAEADDGVRVWLDDTLIVDRWQDQGPTVCVGAAKLKKGRTYRLKVEYYQNGGGACCRLLWRIKKLGEVKHRSVWLPPGRWQNLWTGRRHAGPRVLRVNAELEQMPLFAREGGMVLTIPQSYVTGKPWRAVTVDAFIGRGKAETIRRLYEDDGKSTAYRHGDYAVTPVALEQGRNRVRLVIGPRKGACKGAVRKRAWTLRLHCPSRDMACSMTLDGKPLAVSESIRRSTAKATAHWIRQSEPVTPATLLGEDVRPAPKGGAILEVRIPSRHPSSAVQIDVKWQSKKRG